MQTKNHESEITDLFIPGLAADPSFVTRVERVSGQRVSQCYQCGECTAGCPAAFAMEVAPNRIMRMVQLGCADGVLASATIWLCAGCETCAARCPRGLSLARVMDACRELSAGISAPKSVKNITKFHSQFLTEVARHGRVHEVGLLARYKVLSGDLFGDLPLGLKMFLKGKLALIPSKTRGIDEVRNMVRVASRK